MATSIVDYIFRELAINHLNRDDLAHVLAEDLDSTPLVDRNILQTELLEM